jgi:gentisate 1,2-dioxygenase
MNYSDISYIYVSTEEFTVSWYTIAPGSRFEPADYHAGDEIYIVLEGVLTMINTDTGQVVNIKEGEGLLMPMGASHIGYNFGDVKTKTAAFIAPKIFANQSFPTDTVGRIKLYKGSKNELFKKFEPTSQPNRAGILDDLGTWPIDGPTGRKSNMFYHIPENKKLLAICGQENPVLLKFIVSNDFINVAEMIIPAGGKGARMTDPDKHEGDCAIYLDKGRLSILIHDTGETFQLLDEEAIFIPKNTTYQLFNYEDDTLTPIICTVKL